MLFSKEFIQKERLVWHKHFTPSIIAAFIVAIVTAFMELTLSNVILFSSVAASAFILTHSTSHHLTKLRTTLIAYLIAMFVSGAVYGINLFLRMPMSVNLFIVMFFTGIGMYLANTVHPPAVSACLSFVLLEGYYFSGLASLFFAILLLLILVRFTTYIFTQKLPMKSFLKEFERI